MKPNYSNDESLSFNEIVLSYLKKIMDLNLRVIPQDNYIDYVKTYKRSVMGLSDVLLPFFDDDMNEAYNKFLEDDKDMLENTTNGIIIIKRKRGDYGLITMDNSRNLFRALNKLLNRNDYLKSSIYGEGSDEEIVEDETDDDSNNIVVKGGTK